MSKNYNSKYYLKKELNYLLHKLFKIKTNFELFKDLKSGDEKKYITNKLPRFSQMILTALSNSIFLELSKIMVDSPQYQKDENICISNLIQMYNDNKDLFKLKKYYYITNYKNKRCRRYISAQDINVIIQNLKNKINENNKIYSYLKKLRHKELAHNDKAFGFKTRKKYIKDIVTYKEIEDYINELYNDLNELNRSLFSTTMVFIYEYKEELDWLKEIIKKEEDNNKIIFNFK